MADPDPDAALRGACTRWLRGHGLRSAADMLAELPDDIEHDVYGAGGVVADLEERVADLLGHEAALFLPSGTMAQQIALRIHADARGRRTIAFHPTCHLHRHEDQAHERLHGLHGRPVGEAHRLLGLDDLEAVAEPLAALVLELPQRDIGGQLPAWEDLLAQLAWARARGAATHLDGARVWEAAAGLGRTPAEVAGAFDTAYVSFYKGIGALPGCCLAGSRAMVDEAREWRHRHGGTLWALWPQAASAMAGLDRRLPRMAEYLGHARAIAEALRDVDGVEVVPDPPHTSLLHLYLRTTAEDFLAARDAIARDLGVWTWQASSGTGRPAWRVVELGVGDGTLEFTPHQVREMVARLVAPST